LSANEALKKDFFVDTANNLGSAFADPDVTEPAVNMEGVEVVLDFRHNCLHDAFLPTYVFCRKYKPYFAISNKTGPSKVPLPLALSLPCARFSLRRTASIKALS
jgi:hypothetical protein